MRIASVAEVKAHFSAFLKASQKGPVIVTRNGRPAAVLLSVDEDEIERLVLAYSPRFQRIRETGGIPHDEFWKELEGSDTDDAKE